MKKKVSVIIPVYNGELYIEKSINSVLDQSFKDLEIIVVDDCSTDNTVDIVKSRYNNLINSQRIKLISLPENRGRGVAANTGVISSTCEYIFFLDSDDIWYPSYVETVLEHFKAYNPDIIYTAPHTFIDMDGSKIRSSKKNINVNNFEKHLYSCRIGYPSATAFKRQAFLFYNSSYKYREDIELLLRSYLNGLKIMVLNKDLVFIRQHRSPHRMSLSREFLNYTLKLHEDFHQRVPDLYKPYFYIHISSVAFKFGDTRLGWKFLLKAIRKKPNVILDFRYSIEALKRAFRIDRFFYNLTR